MFKPAISLPAATEHIRACLRHSTAAERKGARHWYQDANVLAQGFATHYKLKLETVCAVIATLSPSLRWETNIDQARGLFQQGSLPFYPGYGPQLVKAERIWMEDTGHPALGGLKVNAFYRLILGGGNNHDVCVDTHTANVAVLGHATPWPWKEPVVRLDRYHHYETIAAAYRHVAWAKGQRPCDVQAQAWLTYRRLKQAWGRVSKSRV